MNNPNVLVLGPGGFKGFCELGALAFLESQGYLDQIETIIGCSIGSIIGTLLICGYSVLEIISSTFEVDILSEIKNFNILEIGDKMGLIDHSIIANQLKDLILKKIGVIPTLKEFHQITGLKLIISTFNLDKSNPEYFSYENHPEIDLIDAILLSCNLPFIFHSLKYNNDTYIDGAFGDPYPINLLDNGNNKILGIYIDTKWDNNDKKDNIFYWYIDVIMHTSINQLIKNNIKLSSKNCFHLKLTISGSDLKLFNYHKTEKEKMIGQGYLEAMKFLEFLKI